MEGALLAHALVARVASDQALRVLAIKGPAVAVQGLREEREPMDVDVLVHPDDLKALVSSLESVGWYDHVQSTAPRILPPHSVNMLHARWTVGIDVHHYFPGFLAGATKVFDALWDRRVTLSMADAPVLSCDPVGQTAVVALHLLRDDPMGTDALLEDLRDRYLATTGTDGISALTRLAHQTGATATLLPFLVSLGVPENQLTLTGYEGGLALWKQHTTAPPSMPWVMQLANAPFRLWPRMLWHGIMLTDEQIRAHHGGGDTRRSLNRARWLRLRRGWQQIPPAIGTYVRDRRWRQRAE